MRKIYPSDIDREKFEKIRLILESVRKKKRKPRKLGVILWCADEKVAVSGECYQKSFQNGAIVTTISRNGVKNRMRIEKMFWLKKDCEQALSSRRGHRMAYDRLNDNQGASACSWCKEKM